MTWIKFDNTEEWDHTDRFGILPCPNGWYAWDTRTREESDVFRDKEDARRWCQEIYDSEAATPFAG